MHGTKIFVDQCYLRPEGAIVYSIDRTYDFPMIQIIFDGLFETSARLWQRTMQLRKIQAFAKFAIDNFLKIKERHLMCGDIEMFVEFLEIFLRKEFVDPKGMFRNVCRQYPYKFLILFHLCRE